MSSTRKFFRWGAIEWTHNPSFRFGVYMSRGEERYCISISFLFQIWISIDAKWSNNSWKYGVQVSSLGLELSYGAIDDIEGTGNIKYIFWSKIIDFFLGKEYRRWTDERYEGTHRLVMEYGDFYNVRVERKTLLAVRPRIFFGRKLWTSWNLTPDRGIPHLGKGENSWDCGDDATHEMSIGDCIDANDALNKMKKSCERNRQRYGMASTIPMVPLPKLQTFGDSETYTQ